MKRVKCFVRLYSVLVALCLFVVGCHAQGSQGEKTTLVDDIPSPGVQNAIKKAYQMVDLCFTPLDSFVANPIKTYYGGKKYKGLVYSSVKETHTFVGMDVSFHSFMTALHNPRSVMYTENVSKPPYHGKNCGAYYGTVCSGLVTYALGLKVYLKSYDYAYSGNFIPIEDQSSKGVRLADVLNSGGHVQLVTAIKRDPNNGRAVEIEICEGVRPGCRRVLISGDELDGKLSRKKRKWKIYRYKYLDSVKYTPLNSFVAVGDEQLIPFSYNEDICTSRGDRVCYIVGDSVKLNFAKGYKMIEVYKDDILNQTIRVGNNMDVVVKGLPYGNYKARAIVGKKKSEYTYWKVIDTKVLFDKDTNLVYFSSKNATPVYLEFTTLSGGRPTSGVFEFTNEDIHKGFVDVSSYVKRDKTNAKYIKVHFESDYGRVTNRAIKWK